MASTIVSRHDAHARICRHRHVDGYAALVLTGGYIEAGEGGRTRVAAGHVLVHQPYEAHFNQFSVYGATVLNIPLMTEFKASSGEVCDPDAIVRAAERSSFEAADLLRDNLKPGGGRMEDWPDELAAALLDDTVFSLTECADLKGLSPQSLSRGFRQTYGTSPKRYRLEQRTLRTVCKLPHWQGSLADLAAEQGWADQAHLTRAVLAVTGTTPHRLRG